MKLRGKAECLSLLTLFSLVAALMAPASAVGAQPTPQQAQLTWMSIANWLFEVGDTRVVVNGYISRIQESDWTGEGPTGLDRAKRPMKPEVENVQRVINAVGNKVDYILTGHSHFDHSWDTAVWAKATGAQVIGSKSTCLELMAQEVPAEQCTMVKGGEKFDLGSGMTARAIRINHSGNPTTQPDLHDPLELSSVPVPDPETGGLRPGILEDFPNGGGGVAFLVTFGDPNRPLSFFYADTGSEFTFDRPVVVDGENLGTPADNIAAAMRDAGLSTVDAAVQGGGAPLAKLIVPIVHERAFIPNHWDGLYAPFFPGMPNEWSNPELEAYLANEGIGLFPPCQYMEKWQIDPSGVSIVPNSEVKQRLGFSECR
jgi:L-ascorbate metabolism protein UlaG (beta-lactamase superfamily)